MDAHTHSEWLKTSEHRVTNTMFYASQALRFTLARKECLMKAKGKLDPTDFTDGKAIMPAWDIANLGKHRASGCCRLCGDFIELYVTTSSYLEGVSPDKTARGKGEEEAKETANNSRMRSIKRAEKSIRRLVNTNHLRYMWTLTLAPPSETNKKKFDCISLNDQKNPDKIKQLWRNFYKRMLTRYPGFKWLVVYELHNSKKTSDTKRGTWHIHFATDMHMKWEIISQVWKHGIVRFDDFQKPKKGVRKGAVRNPGAYMSKYIGKNFDDTNLHVKRYSRSRNMRLPEKIDLHTFFEKFPTLDGLVETFHTTRREIYERLHYYNHNITYRVLATRIPK